MFELSNNSFMSLFKKLPSMVPENTHCYLLPVLTLNVI